MSENPAKTDQLKRHADLLALTLEAVFTDAQAKEVVSGKQTDSYLLKIKIDIDNKTGIIFILVSSLRKHIMEIYVVVGNSPIFRRIKIFSDHVQIATDLAEIGRTDGLDPTLSEQIGQVLYNTFPQEKLDEFLPIWEKKDPSRLSDLLEPAIQNGTKSGRVKIQAEVEKLSSAKFRYDSPMKGAVSPISPPVDEKPAVLDLSQTPKTTTTEMTPLERQILHLRQGFERELTMKTVISPVGGKEFDSLVAGQEILFRVPMETDEGMANARLLGLVDEDGKLSKEPVIAKFRGIASAKNEYHIFAEGPNQYLFHSIEESPVKVAVPKPIPAAVSNVPTAKATAESSKKKTVEVKKNSVSLNSILGILVGIVLIVVLVLVLTAF